MAKNRKTGKERRGPKTRANEQRGGTRKRWPLEKATTGQGWEGGDDGGGAERVAASHHKQD